VSSVVIAGIAGARETALLVLREPDGLPLPDVGPERVTDAVPDDAWQNLARLHQAGLAHGMTQAANVVLLADGTTAFVDFAHASSRAPAERRLVDAVELLATSAALVGEERGPSAAVRALGRAGLADVLPLLEPAALSAETRRKLPERNALPARLREQGAALTGGEVATLTKLRRVSPGDLLIAAGTILGVFLLIGQLAGVDFATVFANAEWGWVGSRS
jgi:glycosyltransferase 2 family protein